MHGDDAWLPQAPHEYLVAMFTDCGRVESGFNGPTPLSWKEIYAFNEMRKIGMEDWEADAVRKMSESYCRWYSAGQDKNCEPPIAPDDPNILKAIQAANIRAFKAARSGN